MSDSSTDSRPHGSGTMAAKHWPSVLWFLGVVIVVLAADLISKSLAFTHVAGEQVVLTPENVTDYDTIPPHDAITVVPNVLSLKLTVNTGAVFGLGKGQRTAFILISIVAVAVISYVFLKSPAGEWGNHLAWALILAGALGNLYDRILYSGVRDMLWLFPGVKLPFGWRWPQGGSQFAPWVDNTGPDELYPWIFNIADVALVVGVALVILISFKHERARAKAEKKTAS